MAEAAREGTPAYFWWKAQQARRLAAGISDGPGRDAVLAFAAECEARAIAAEADAALGESSPGCGS